MVGATPDPANPPKIYGLPSRPCRSPGTDLHILGRHFRSGHLPLPPPTRPRMLNSVHIGPNDLTITIGGIVFAILCASIAQGRGRNPVLWGVIGLFTTVIGLIILLVLSPVDPATGNTGSAFKRSRRRQQAAMTEPAAATMPLPPAAPPRPSPPPPPPPPIATTGAIAWHYAVERTVHGPVAEPELRHLLRTRALDAQTLVWSEGMAEWQRAGNVATLRADLG